MSISLNSRIEEKKLELDMLMASCSSLTCEEIIIKSQELDELIVEKHREMQINKIRN